MFIEIQTERTRYSVNLDKILFVEEYPSQASIVFADKTHIDTGLSYDQVMKIIQQAQTQKQLAIVLGENL